MISKNKREILQRYDGDEVKFLDDVLIPLFERMNFVVHRNHGSTEFGKDIVLKTSDVIGNETAICVVAKCGEIANTSAGKKKKTVDEIQRQALQSWKMPLDRFNLKGILPNQVWIVTNNKISGGARDEIVASVQDYNKSNTRFLSYEELIPLIDKHNSDFWIYSLPTFSSHLKDLNAHIENRTLSSNGFKASVGNLIGTQCWRIVATEGKGRQSEVRKPLDIIRETSFTWIQGGTGSGKTFIVKEHIDKILKSLEGDHIDEDSDEAVEGVIFPIYLRASLIDGPVSLDSIFKLAAEYSPNLQRDDFDKWIKKHPVVLFVDEFEINQQQDIITSAHQAIKEVSKLEVKVVILSRQLDESSFRFHEAPSVWMMRDINLNSASKMVLQAFPDENKKGKKALKEMIQNGIIERIPRTPLALNILRQIFADENTSVPNNAWEFFDMFFQVVLGRWERNRKTLKPFDYRQIRSLLQGVAFRMVERGLVQINVTELLDIAQEILDATNTEYDPEMYLKEVCEIGDICSIDNGIFEFNQRTYQEFLAGCELVQHHWDHEFIIEKLTDVSWEDAIIFGAGSKQKDNALLQALDSVKAELHRDQFFKMKNIGLLIQSLYQSSNSAKAEAIKIAANVATKLRDDADFSAGIKKLNEKYSDLEVSLLTLKLFSLYFAKTTVVPGLREIVKKSKNSLGREGFYVVAAITGMDEESFDADLLKESVEKLDKDLPSPEADAFGGFLRMERRSNTTIKGLLHKGKARKMAEKTRSVYIKKSGKESKFIKSKK